MTFPIPLLGEKVDLQDFLLSECKECGVPVINTEKHDAWHKEQLEKIKRAFPAVRTGRLRVR